MLLRIIPFSAHLSVAGSPALNGSHGMNGSAGTLIVGAGGLLGAKADDIIDDDSKWSYCACSGVEVEREKLIDPGLRKDFLAWKKEPSFERGTSDFLERLYREDIDLCLVSIDIYETWTTHWPCPPAFVDASSYITSRSSRHKAHFGAKCVASVLILPPDFLERLYREDIDLFVVSSVTRWLDYLFNIWLLTTVEICPKALKFAQKLYKFAK